MGAASYQPADLFEPVADVVPTRVALVAGSRRLTDRELEADDRWARAALGA